MKTVKCPYCGTKFETKKKYADCELCGNGFSVRKNEVGK